MSDNESMEGSERATGPVVGHTLGVAAKVGEAVSNARLRDLAGRPPAETLGELVGDLRRIVGEADQPDAATETAAQAPTSVWILESGLATETEILGVFATRGLAIQAAEHEEAPSSSWQRVRDELVWRDRSYRMDISEHPVEAGDLRAKLHALRTQSRADLEAEVEYLRDEVARLRRSRDRSYEDTVERLRVHGAATGGDHE